MQISDTTAIKTCRFGLLKNQVLQCKYGETAICSWRYSSEQIYSPVSDSSRSGMYTVRKICGTASTIYAQYRPVLPKIEAIACTQKRQAKQPCLDTEGATESDGCSSSVQMDDIHVKPR